MIVLLDFVVSQTRFYVHCILFYYYFFNSNIVQLFIK